MTEEKEHKSHEHREHKVEHVHHKAEHKKPKTKLNTPLILIIVGIILLVVVEAQILSLNSKVKEITGETGAATAVESEAPPDAPSIDFYVMSYCPYGNQAEEGIAPVYELLKGKAHFNPHYVIYSNYRGGGPDYCLDPESKYCSMHGIQELNQNIRELCVNKYIGTDAYFDFVLEMNKQCNSGNADTCWEPVAQGLGLDVEVIKTCEEEEAIEFAAEDLALNQQLGVRGSPTIFIGGEQYTGGRAPGDYLNALCNEFMVKPDECNTQLQTSAAAASGQC